MSRYSRRSFVKKTAAAAAAISVAPYISNARAQSPNETLGVAIVGAGGRGGSHVGGFLGDSRTDILYVVDPDKNHAEGKAKSIARKQKFAPKIITDMRECLDDDNVTIITCATPNHWHALCGVWAMQAGKDCYLEKPISHNVMEGAALVAAAKKYKKICQVGTQCRSNPAIQKAVKFLNEGGIGDVKFARGLCIKRRAAIGPLGDYPIPGNIDFNLWSGPAQYTDPRLTRQRLHYDWHWQRLYGNGDSGNQGPHQTDIARWGLGIDTHPTNIISYGGRLGYQAEKKDDNYVDAGDTPNTEVTVLDYGDKCIVFETRGLASSDATDPTLYKLFKSKRGNLIGVIFYGTKGILVQRQYTHCIAYDLDMNPVKEFKGGGNHYGNFIDSCLNRKSEDLNADAWEGHLSASMAHLGNISYYLGEQDKATPGQITEALSSVKSLDENAATLARTVKHLEANGNDMKKYPLSLGPALAFDPAREFFTNSDDANAMLTRDYRKGFECPTADKV